MTFDIQRHKNAVIDAANATTWSAYPVGEYSGQIKVAELSDKSGVFDDGTPWAIYDVEMNITDKTTGRSKDARLGFRVTFKSDDSGQPEDGPNKNIMLGQFRKALGMNGPGFTWNKPVGHFVTCVVGHRLDDKDPEKVYETPKGWKAA